MKASRDEIICVVRAGSCLRYSGSGVNDKEKA
jgi:hypothetical protein